MRARSSATGGRAALFGAVALSAAALGAGSAQAATLTLGNPLTGPGYGVSGFSSGPYTILNTTLISGQPPGSPVDGTVVSWAVGSPDGEFGLQILRPEGGFYRGVGQSAVGQLVFDPAPSPPQPTSMPIAKGDVIALRTGGGTSLFRSSSGSSARLEPALGLGETSGPPAASSTTNNYVFNATVRYCRVPKLKGTKKGKVRKVLARNDCAAGTIRTLKKKGAKGSVLRAVGQFPAPGSAISDTEGVDVRLKPVAPKKKRK